MGMQIIHHQTKVLGVGRMLIHKCLEKVRPVNFCALICHVCSALTRSRFKSHQKIRGPLALLFCGILQRLPRLPRQRLAHCPKELARHGSHTPLWRRGIIRCFIEGYGFFPLADTGGV